MIFFVVSPLPASAVADWARERGWTRIGAGRFATPKRDDARVVRRMSEWVPLRGGKAMLMRGPGYETDLPGWGAAERDAYKAFVAGGYGQWIGAKHV